MTTERVDALTEQYSQCARAGHGPGSRARSRGNKVQDDFRALQMPCLKYSQYYSVAHAMAVNVIALRWLNKGRQKLGEATGAFLHMAGGLCLCGLGLALEWEPKFHGF